MRLVVLHDPNSNATADGIGQPVEVAPSGGLNMDSDTSSDPARAVMSSTTATTSPCVRFTVPDVMSIVFHAVPVTAVVPGTSVADTENEPSGRAMGPAVLLTPWMPTVMLVPAFAHVTDPVRNEIDPPPAALRVLADAGRPSIYK